MVTRLACGLELCAALWLSTAVAHADDYFSPVAEGGVTASHDARWEGGAGVAFSGYPGDPEWYFHGFRIGAVLTLSQRLSGDAELRPGIAAEAAMLLVPEHERNRVLLYASIQPWLDFDSNYVNGSARAGTTLEVRIREIASNLRLGVFWSPAPRLGWAAVAVRLTLEYNLPPSAAEQPSIPPELQL